MTIRYYVRKVTKTTTHFETYRVPTDKTDLESHQVLRWGKPIRDVQIDDPDVKVLEPFRLLTESELAMSGYLQPTSTPAVDNDD